MDYQARLDELDSELSRAAQRRDNCGANTPEGAAFADEVASLARQIIQLRRSMPQLNEVNRRISAVESRRDREIRRADERAQGWMHGCLGAGISGGLVLLVSLGFHLSAPTPYLVAVVLLGVAAFAFAVAGRARRKMVALESAAAEHLDQLDVHRASLTTPNESAA